MSLRISPDWPGDKLNATEMELRRSGDRSKRVCRLCCKDGLPTFRHRWHPKCGSIAGASRYLQAGLNWCARRQQGICAGDGCVWRIAERVEKSPWNSTGWSVYVENVHVELDHIVPLWKVAMMGEPRDRALRWWLPGNLQALCRECHRTKTSAEAGERARLKAVERTGQQQLF